MRGIFESFLCRKRVPCPITHWLRALSSASRTPCRSPQPAVRVGETGVRGCAFERFRCGPSEKASRKAAHSGHEGVAEMNYAAGMNNAQFRRPGVETGVPARCPGFCSRTLRRRSSLPAFSSGEKQMEQAKPAPRQYIIAAQQASPSPRCREILKRLLLFADERKYDMPSLGWKGEP